MSVTTRTETLNTLNVTTGKALLSMVSQMNDDNPIQSRLMNKAKSGKGGELIEVPLLYGRENTKTMGEWEEYDLQPNEIMDKAWFQWKIVHGDMVLSTLQVDVQNVGQAKLIDLAMAKVKNMRTSMSNQFSELLYTANADLEDTDPDSLLRICATEDNTVGGIDASSMTNFDWNPTILDYSGDGINPDDLVNPASDHYIEKIIRRIVSELTYGKDKPTLIVTTQGIWDALEEAYRADKRLNDNLMTAEGGFDILKFRNIHVVVDNHVPGGKLNTTDDNGAMMLVLNESYLDYRYAPNINWKWQKWIKAEKQGVYFSTLDWVGNLVCSRRDRQGSVKGLPTDSQIFNA